MNPAVSSRSPHILTSAAFVTATTKLVFEVAFYLVFGGKAS